jgi:hypothetical protein
MKMFEIITENELGDGIHSVSPMVSYTNVSKTSKDRNVHNIKMSISVPVSAGDIKEDYLNGISQVLNHIYNNTDNPNNYINILDIELLMTDPQNHKVRILFGIDDILKTLTPSERVYKMDSISPDDIMNVITPKFRKIRTTIDPLRMTRKYGMIVMAFGKGKGFTTKNYTLDISGLENKEPKLDLLLWLSIEDGYEEGKIQDTLKEKLKHYGFYNITFR